MQLILRVLAGVLLAAIVALAPATALADGEVSMRGVYYKERATRVIQPMLDGMFEVGTHGIATVHVLADAITSASSASGAADNPFTETRYEGGGTYTHDFGAFRVSGTAKYSDEPDYISRYGGVRAELDLAEKNTTLGLGIGFVSDTLSAGQAQGLFDPMIACSAARPDLLARTCDLDTTMLTASISQVLSKTAVIGVSYDLTQATGYLSNAYRQVLAGLILAPERHPNERLRQAFGVTARYFVRDTKTTLIGAYRYYRDDWKVRAHTPEVRIIQDVGYTIDAAIRYRYYRQTKAFFYEPRYDTADVGMEPFLSNDPKLTKFDGHTFEAKLGILGETFGLEDQWSEARLEGIIQYIIQNNQFGNAVVAHVALTIPFTY